jgi:hypothetical protein
VGKYDAAVMGVPFDGGATYRPEAACKNFVYCFFGEHFRIPPL